jgi:hypothetical protein
VCAPDSGDFLSIWRRSPRRTWQHCGKQFLVLTGTGKGTPLHRSDSATIHQRIVCATFITSNRSRYCLITDQSSIYIPDKWGSRENHNIKGSGFKLKCDGVDSVWCIDVHSVACIAAKYMYYAVDEHDSAGSEKSSSMKNVFVKPIFKQIFYKNSIMKLNCYEIIKIHFLQSNKITKGAHLYKSTKLYKSKPINLFFAHFFYCLLWEEQCFVFEIS